MEDIKEDFEGTCQIGAEGQFWRAK